MLCKEINIVRNWLGSHNLTVQKKSTRLAIFMKYTLLLLNSELHYIIFWNSKSTYERVFVLIIFLHD